MTEKSGIVYPYIPNSAPEVRQEMLNATGANSIEDFYQDIPDDLRVAGLMNLPEPFLSEYALKRHVTSILKKNTTCEDLLSFLGAGCYQHHVPAVCDEINRRSEFLTAYAGEPYDDHGRFQALFETASMMGELLDMEVVNVPTYDGYQASATSIRMAVRMTGRKRVLVSDLVNPEKLSKIREYCAPDIRIDMVGHNPDTGLLELADLEKKSGSDVAGVYFENPSFPGNIELNGQAISDLAHRFGAECIVSVDPISLGVLKPPAAYGADIVCGDLQPLGMHMSFGGGHAGFIATRDELRYVQEYPSRLFGISSTCVAGEYGFGDVFFDRTSFAIREEGKEWVGTAAALWGITTGVYLALMGPQGMKEIGERIMQRSRFAAERIASIKGVCCPVFTAPFFKEFAVDFSGTGRTVAEINKKLLEKGILGGKDLSGQSPEFNGCALFCVTEIHTRDDIEMLAAALEEVLR